VSWNSAELMCWRIDAFYLDWSFICEPLQLVLCEELHPSFSVWKKKKKKTSVKQSITKLHRNSYVNKTDSQAFNSNTESASQTSSPQIVAPGSCA